MSKNKKKKKKQKPITTTFEYNLPSIQEYSERDKIEFSITLLPVLERVMTGCITNISGELKEPAADPLRFSSEFIRLAETLHDYQDRIHKIINYTFPENRPDKPKLTY